MQVDYLKRRFFLEGKIISEGFSHWFSASFQPSQVSQATRNRAISPLSDAKAAGEEDSQGFGKVLS